MLQIEINRGLGQPCHTSIDRFGSQTDQRGLIALRWTLGFIIGPQREKAYPLGVCEQQWRRPACTSAQSDQRLCYSLCGKFHM